MRYAIVAGDHWVAHGVKVDRKTWRADARMSRQAKAFWRRCCLQPTPFAVVAIDRGVVVGWFRFHSEYEDDIYACGTWTEPAYRGRGIAVKLWRHAVDAFRVKKIFVLTVSPGGASLIRAMEKLYPGIKFDIEKARGVT